MRLRVERERTERKRRRAERFANADCFDSVITFKNFIAANRKCIKGVRWKGSVQKYESHGITEISNAITTLRAGKLPPFTSTHRIKLSERGKIRTITPVTMRDRMVQRTLCDNSLVPILQSTLIYDNGASMKGKGVDFARNRLNKPLIDAVREYGPESYALIFDFKSFFDSIPHATCEKVLRENFTDEHIITLTMEIIKSYQYSTVKKLQRGNERDTLFYELDHNESRGICLGSQISQIMALAVPNTVDHLIKDKYRVKHYMRFMDDGILFAKNKRFLQEVYSKMMVLANRLGLKFNDKKTHITKLTKGFTFLKVRYRVTPTGRIVKKLAKTSIVRMRRKLKKFRHLVDDGNMTLNDVYNSMQSWCAHTKVAMSYHAKKNMLKLYDELFDGYKLTNKYNHLKGGKNGELLQADKWAEYRWGCIAA